MARVLVVDDEELARFTMREILKAAGHKVFEAGSGEEAMAAVVRHRIDVVVTDVIMPGKDGLKVTIGLRRDHPEVKVIAVSGGGRTTVLDFLTLAKASGAHEVLAKPFDEAQLVAAVDACLKK